MRQIPCTTSSTRLVFKFALTSFNSGLPVPAYLGELVLVHTIWVYYKAPQDLLFEKIYEKIYELLFYLGGKTTAINFLI